MKVVTQSFSYTRESGEETCNDGMAYRVPGGVVISMWGDENTYHFTVMVNQSGEDMARLTETIVDARDIPTHFWKFQNLPFGDPGRQQYCADYWHTICREAAEIIGSHTDDMSKKRISDLLFEMEVAGNSLIP